MHTYVKHSLILLFVLLLGNCLGNDVIAAEYANGKEDIVKKAVEIDVEDFPENEELFAGYVDQVLYGDLYEEISVYGNVGKDRLKTEEEKVIYSLLKEQIEEVAAGTRESTEFVFYRCLEWTAEELGVSKITSDKVGTLAEAKLAEVLDMEAVLSYLRMDCPYDLYWYDKVVSTYFGYGYSYQWNKLSMNIIVQMPVANEYLGAGESVYQVNTELAKSVETAKNKAVSIVKENESATDYQKLLAYKNAICSLTSYNHSVTGANSGTPYGNPWQLIWVFDEEESTKVVCEGYAKAFQYLCDLSHMTCYTVTGNLTSGTGAGPHMWNIVTLNGKNYLVDVTNCDSGTVGYPDKLFLAGTPGSVESGYQFPLSYNVLFTYKDEQIRLLGNDLLTLAETNYEEAEKSAIAVTDVFFDIVSGGWYIDAIQYVYDEKIMTGTGLTTFAPNNEVTRAMVVETLYKMEDKPEITDFSGFGSLNDFDQNAWWAKSVEWAIENGVATGYTNTNTFDAEKNVTREQLATFLYRYAKECKGISVELSQSAEQILGDTQVSTWAQQAFAWAIDTGLITGIEGKDDAGNKVLDLSPGTGATRAQLATILTRFCKRIVENR